MISELEALQLFGRQWDQFSFRVVGRIDDPRTVGDGSHLKLVLDLDSQPFDVIWFNTVQDGVCPVRQGQTP